MYELTRVELLRDLVKQTIHEIVVHPENEPLASVRQSVARHVPKHERPGARALIIEERKRLHEGALARHGVRPSEDAAWKAAHQH